MVDPLVADVMTREVVTAAPETPFKELAMVMVEHQVDAVPVVDAECRLVGVVHDADLVAKMEFHGGADYPPLLAGSRSRARWRKSFMMTAGELMTTSVGVVRATSSLITAVYAMSDNSVRRLYVVDEKGLLVGLLLRTDALKIFLRSDDAIEADIRRVITAPLRRHGHVSVRVTEGVATLEGAVDLHSVAERLWMIAQHVPGVVTVKTCLTYDLDDLTITGL